MNRFAIMLLVLAGLSPIRAIAQEPGLATWWESFMQNQGKRMQETALQAAADLPDASTMQAWWSTWVAPNIPSSTALAAGTQAARQMVPDSTTMAQLWQQHVAGQLPDATSMAAMAQQAASSVPDATQAGAMWETIKALIPASTTTAASPQ